MNTARLRLIVAAALFLGWLGWLGYTTLAKNHGPVVSKAQAAAATNPVIAEVSAVGGKPQPEVKVIEALKKDTGPKAGDQVFVANLAELHGFDGPGTYLLLLAPEPNARPVPAGGKELQPYLVVGQQGSPGYESLAGSGLPMIYRWTPQVEAQARKLFP